MLDSGFMPLFNLREVTEISKVVDVLLPLVRKQWSLVHGESRLFTLHTLLKAVVCCLQLNTGGGSDDNPKVEFYGARRGTLLVTPSAGCEEHINKFSLS